MMCKVSRKRHRLVLPWHSQSWENWKHSHGVWILMWCVYRKRCQVPVESHGTVLCGEVAQVVSAPVVRARSGMGSLLRFCRCDAGRGIGARSAWPARAEKVGDRIQARLGSVFVLSPRSTFYSFPSLFRYRRSPIPFTYHGQQRRSLIF